MANEVVRVNANEIKELGAFKGTIQNRSQNSVYIIIKATAPTMGSEDDVDGAIEIAGGGAIIIDGTDIDVGTEEVYAFTYWGQATLATVPAW